LSGFDCVILPGSKNTVEDLEELKAAGGFERVKEFAALGKPVIGICGGYQMMGETIFDDAFEGTVSKEYEGLGLLSMRTEFLTDKKITIQKSRAPRSVGPILSRMGTVHGYEIHTGVSEVFGESAFEDEGAVADGGLVFGTYLHGLFDNASAVDALVSYLAEVRGISYEPVAEKGDPYDNLARHLENCLDVDMLMEIIGL
jgi:adenosylcobyric acid synthase